MPVIDEEGLVFRKLNLIDATAGVLVLVLVPLVYGAYLLFHTPEPVIHPIPPATVTEGTEDHLMVVTGEHLRPFLRVMVGDVQATYLFETSERAVVRLPAREVGTYDLVFYDEAREITRQKEAITFIVPPLPPVPVTVVRLIGAFVGLSLERATGLETDATVAAEATAGWGAEIVQLGAVQADVTRFRENVLPASVIVGRYRVPAVLRVRTAYIDGRLQLLDDEGRVFGSDPRWGLSEEVRKALASPVEPGVVLSIPGAVRRLLSKGVSNEEVSFYVERIQSDSPAQPPPPAAITTVRLLGAFTGLTPERAQALQTNAAVAREMTAGWGAEILRLNAPEPDVAVLPTGNVPPSVLMGRQRVPAVVRVRCAVVNGVLQLLDSEGRFVGTDPALELSDHIRRALATTVAAGAVLSIPAAVRQRGPSGAGWNETVIFHVQSVQPDPPIAPPPPSGITTVRLVGAFSLLSPERAEALRTNPAVAREMTAGWGAEILGLNTPEPDIAVLKNDLLPSQLAGRQRVPAVLRLRCAVVDGTLQLLDSKGDVMGSLNPGIELSEETRRALSVTVSRGAVLSIPAAFRFGTSTTSRDVVTFHVEQVYPDGTQLIQVTARILTRPPLVELLRKSLADPEPPAAFAALRPRLLSFEVEREMQGVTFDELRQGTTSILVASFRLPAVRTPTGWDYGGQQLKPGVEFFLETPTYRVFSQVLAIEDPKE